MLKGRRKWILLLLVVPGGLIVLIGGYLFLRAGGLMNKYWPSKNKWIEYDA